MEKEYQNQARQEIAKWESTGPGFLSQVGDFVLTPARKAAEALIPKGAQDVIEKTIHGFLAGLRSGTSATFSRDEVRNRVKGHLEKCGDELQASDTAAKHYWNWHLGYAAAEGGATGAAGILGLPADIPALFGLCLRLIQEMATCYGYDVEQEEEL
ncbi:MAG: EcsC family protein [Planctomycetota bacterium]|nr:EcsC family protein [Planctomycetota bacterium]